MQRSWVIIPAAGIGRRMGIDYPKQYSLICQKTVLEHSLNLFLNDDRFTNIIIALHPDDNRWSTLSLAKHPKIITVIGGAERRDSVLNALQAIDTKAHEDDWVFVHDAARPLLTMTDLNALINAVKDDQVGGLLGVPINATLKKINHDHRVDVTIPREQLWEAQTPQVFKFSILKKALSVAGNVTDCASAIEYLNLNPLMVEAHDENRKITRASDLIWAEQILTLRRSK